MVQELSPDQKKALFAKLDRVMEQHKSGNSKEVKEVKSFDKPNEKLDATDDYYFNLKNKKKPNFKKKSFDWGNNQLLQKFVDNFDRQSFLQSIGYAFFATIVYLLLTFIFFKFVLIKSTEETFNFWVSIFWIALLAFDLPLFPVTLSSAWAMAKQKEMGLYYSMLSSLCYFIIMFVVFVVFGLTKNSLLAYPGYLFVLLILITALVRGYLGYMLGDWYRGTLVKQPADDFETIR